MTARPRIAVIGLGSMGRNHARILATMPEAELVAVADADATAVQRAGLHYLPCYATHGEMFARETLDAVVVATPTRSHAEIATEAITRGLAVLVEKPIASTVDEGRQIVDLARSAGVVLAVGHVERFNPAVQELRKRLNGGEIGRLFQLKVRREGPFPTRIGDVGVAFDLATHDLDILGHLLHAVPEMLFAQVAKRVHAAHEDLLTATLRYPGDILATLDVNWLTPTKIRQLAVNGERGLFLVDYLTQDLTWYENSEVDEGWDALATLRGVSEGRAVRYPLHRREPLALELTSFLTLVSGGEATVVTGEDGLRALSLAVALLESARTDTIRFNPLEEVMQETGSEPGPRQTAP